MDAHGIKPRKRPCNPSKWKKNKIKKNKTSGVAHQTYNGDIVAAKICRSEDCRCNPKCSGMISDAERSSLFQDYYKLEDHSQEILYLRGNISKSIMGRNLYQLKLTNRTIYVCQKYFIGVFGLKKSSLRNKVLNLTESALDMRGRHHNHVKLPNHVEASIRTFLQKLEARESHYSREKNKNKVYLDSNKCVATLYKDFLKDNPNFDPSTPPGPNCVPVKSWAFYKIFNYQCNIGFGFPRSDICEFCEKIQVQIESFDGNDSEELQEEILQQQQEHFLEAEEFYKSMRKENLVAAEVNICFDFQKNLPLPVTNITAEYFLSQLWLYNFCIHDMNTEKATMFLYTENFANKGSNETASCLKYYFENQLPAGCKKVNIWCDNSFAQNKNKFILAVLQTTSYSMDIEFHIRYPIPGHSRLPCDADFGLIEQKRRKTDKFILPSDYVKLIKDCQSDNKFKLVFVEHSLTDDLQPDRTPIVQIKDFKSVLTPLLKTSFKINTMRQIKISQNQITSAPCTYSTLFAPVDIVRPGIFPFVVRNAVCNAGRAYQGYLPIAHKKYENVRKLLDCIHLQPGQTFYTSVTSNLLQEESEDEESDQ